MKHCTSCTCGLTAVEWSDRSGYVNLADPNDIADVVVNCALDHSYDRPGTGIPYGYPATLETLLIPVVAKHLSAINPAWKDETVYMDKAAQAAFLADLTFIASDWVKSSPEGERGE